MKILAFSLIPALMLLGACGNTPPENSDDSGTDSESASSGGSDTSANPETTDDPTTTAGSNTNGSMCVPGQSIACSCQNGLDGAQVCNDAGTAYDPCVCTGSDTSVSTDPDTTDPGTTNGPTTDPDTTNGPSSTTDIGESSTTDVGESSTGGSSTGGESSTGDEDQPYGPCPGGNDDCLMGEQCAQGDHMDLGPWTICTPDMCQGEGDCDVTPDDVCNDAPGDGMMIQYCLPGECDDQNPCPMGMECYPPTFGMGPSVCLWPNN